MQYLEENLQRDWHADYNYVPFNLICNISYFAGHNYEILPRRWNGQNNKSKSYSYKNIASVHLRSQTITFLLILWYSLILDYLQDELIRYIKDSKWVAAKSMIR